MKKAKILALLVAVVMILVSFAACAPSSTNEEVSTDAENATKEIMSTENNTDVINVSFLKGPTGMGGAYMWTKSDNDETRNKYNISLDTDATTVGPKLITGEYDIAAILDLPQTINVDEKWVDFYSASGKATVCERKLGDMDGDCEITNADVLAIFRYIYNSRRYPLEAEWAADVNGDGLITNADVLRIFRYIYNPELYPIE